MNSEIISKTHLFRLPLICRICGDVARGLNFDVVTCMACKAFFRRNALRKIANQECKRGSNCEITIKTRTRCSACRLRKCFELGMKPYLIRSFYQTQNVYKHFWQPIPINQQQASTLSSEALDLFSYNHSTLVTKQFNLPSNIMQLYDEQNTISNIKCLLAERSSLGVNLPIRHYLC